MKKPKILIATTSNGKARELATLLKKLPFSFVSLKDIGIDKDVEETGSTFEEKLNHYYELDESADELYGLIQNKLAINFKRGAPKRALSFDSSHAWKNFSLKKHTTISSKYIAQWGKL